MTCSALVLTGLLFAQTAPPVEQKPIMKRGLEATGLIHGDSASKLSYVVNFTQPEDRTRTVYVAVTPVTVGELKQHAIYTSVWSGGGPAPSGELISKVFAMSKKTGHFYLFKDSKGNHDIRFGVHFNELELAAEPKSSDPSVMRLKDLIFFVNQVGEETYQLIKNDK